MTSVLDYHEGATLLHRANPITKVAFAVCVCVATLLAGGYPMLVGIIVLLVLVGGYAGIASDTLRLLGAFAGLGTLMLVVQTALVRQGTVLFLWVTDRGLDMGAHVALRLVAFALPLVMMLMVTRLTDLANAAVEVLHVPYRYAFTITTALRFVPIFSEQMGQIMEAQTARGVAFDSPNPLRRLRLMLPLIAPLLISSVAKADDTALAAEERGFYLRSRTSSSRRYPFGMPDVLVASAAVAIVTLGALF